LQCACIYQNQFRKPNPQALPKYNSSIIDDFSSFRYFVKLLNNRHRDGRIVQISIHDIKQLWDNQKGKCAITGIELVVPRTSSGFAKDEKSFRCASLDRIDNKQGYVAGNVHFVSRMVNYARNNSSIEDFKEFLKACFGSVK
jgi:hypothetical protein